MQESFKIKSELSERQIESDLITYLRCISNPDAPFRFIDINEKLKGADKRIDLIIPLYLQFKVSHGLKKLNNNFSIYSIRPSPLQKIRLFRMKNQLLDNPTLYFQLKEKEKHDDEDFQHNILFELNRFNKTEAFYVAPLTIIKKDYDTMLFDSMNKNVYPSFHKEHIPISQKNWLSFIGLDPFLRGRISITPIWRVNSHHHYYSFSHTGSEIGWHFQHKMHGGSLLSLTIKQIFNDALFSESRWVSPEDHIESLKKLSNKFKLDISFGKKNSPIQQLQSFGTYLHYMYDIRQLLLGTTRDELKEWIS